MMRVPVVAPGLRVGWGLKLGHLEQQVGASMSHPASGSGGD